MQFTPVIDNRWTQSNGIRDKALHGALYEALHGVLHGVLHEVLYREALRREALRRKALRRGSAIYKTLDVGRLQICHEN